MRKAGISRIHKTKSTQRIGPSPGCNPDLIGVCTGVHSEGSARGSCCPYLLPHCRVLALDKLPALQELDPEEAGHAARASQ